MIMLVRTVEDTNIITPIFKPFHIWVWLTALFAVVGVAFVTTGFATICGNNVSPVTGLKKWIWYTISTFLFQGEATMIFEYTSTLR